MKIIEDLLEELYKFSIDISTFNEPLEDETPLLEFEKKYNIKLPKDYKYLLSKHDGIGLMGDDVSGFKGNNDLVADYEFEHFESGNPQYSYLVPFSPDGFGNCYCFDTSKIKGNSCPIIFWDHELEYTETDPPEIDSESFSDWLKQRFINETLENYDYEGNE
jgi:hypothetical protein